MAVKKCESIILYYVWLDILTKDYTDEEIGKFLRDAYAYARYGTEPEYEDRGLRALWYVVRDGIDKNVRKYEAKSRQAAKAVAQRWEKNDASASGEMHPHTDGCERIPTDASAPYIYDYNYDYNYSNQIQTSSYQKKEPVWEDL